MPERVLVRFEVLGPLLVRVGDRSAVPGGRVLPLLLGAMIATDCLITNGDLTHLLWPDGAPDNPLGALQVAVSRLRRWLREIGALEVEVQRTNAGVTLLRHGAGSDVADFRSLLRRAGSADRSQRSELLTSAMGLWRGPLLAGLHVGAAAAGLLGRLEAERAATAQALAVELVASGQAGRAADLLEPIAASRPLCEETHAALIRTQGAAGRQAAALHAYEAIRARLADDLGIDPSPALKSAQLAVLRQEHAPARVATLPSPPPPPVLRAVPSGPSSDVPCLLPPAVTDFTGRATEVEQMAEGLAGAPSGSAVASRLVTLSGRPGVGKTALALHVAHLLRARFPGGQLYANLGASGVPADPMEVLARFLRELGDPPTTRTEGREDLISRYRHLVAQRPPTLVVLDDACSETQVRPLLPSTAGGAAVVVSRSRLSGLEGAATLPLSDLTEDDSLALLARIIGDERVASDPAAGQELVRLCGRNPLAVRIAGVRLLARPTWPVSRLVLVLGDERRRLDELVAGDLQVRSSLTSSYSTLGPARQALLRGLGLRPEDEFTPPVGGDVLGVDALEGWRLMESLVDAQLLETLDEDGDGNARYRMHDLVRLYAVEQATIEDIGTLDALRPDPGRAP